MTAGSTATPAPALPRFYFVTGIGVLIALAAVALVVGHALAVSQIVDRLASAQLAFAREIEADVWPRHRVLIELAMTRASPSELRAHPAVPALREAILEMSAGTPVSAFALYDREGRAIVSSDDQLIGEYPELNEPVREADSYYWRTDWINAELAHVDAGGDVVIGAVVLDSSKGTARTRVTLEMVSDVTAEMQAVRTTELAVGIPVFALLAVGAGLALFLPRKSP